MSSTDYFTGTFRLTDGREVFGSLEINGKDSRLSLFDDVDIYPTPDGYSYVTGELHDGRLVTLLECGSLSTGSKSSSPDRRKHYAQLFPRYIALGSSHISPSEPCISQISFAMRDASAVFYDFGAFSIVSDSTPFISLLQNDRAKFGHADIGKHPFIGYFTGKLNIAVVETVLGKVRAHHKPSYLMPTPRGVRIDNKVMVTLTPPEPLIFQEGIIQLYTLLRFFELILGRQQPLTDLNVILCDQVESSAIEIHRSSVPESSISADSDELQLLSPRDVLVSIVDSVEKYSTVLVNYLALDKERHDSRQRLQRALSAKHQYTIDRIISAANIFDILPESAYPKQKEVPEELAVAKEEARKLFKALPDSIERSSILNALGRIGGLSLKEKIIHRVKSTGLDEHFPQLIDVLKEAVNCRNHFVHGSPGRVDYSANLALVIFFTNSLEFSFAVSDLIDVGWDFTCWEKGYSHPFGAFITHYPEQLNHFNELMHQAIKH